MISNKKNKINLKNSTNIIFPLSILALLFIILSLSIVSINYVKSKSLKKLERELILATKLSGLVHNIQKERGMSIGFISSKGRNFSDLLRVQRDITDKNIANLNLYIKHYRYLSQNDLSKRLKNVLSDINHIFEIREKIDSLTVDSDYVRKFYSNFNERILNLVLEISKISSNPIITQNITSYSNFLYSKEYAGLERAVGTQILSKDKVKQKEINEFNTLIVQQNVYNKLFLKYASNDLKKQYLKILNGDFIKDIDYMREEILSADKNSISSIDVKRWFDTTTKKIDKLKVIDDYLSKNIITTIKHEISKTTKRLILIIVLNIIGFIIFIFMILRIFNLLSNEKKLKMLIDKYVITSSTDLKGVITDVTEAFCKISGYSKDELIGKPHNIVRHPDMPKESFVDLWKTLKEGKTWMGNVKNLKKNGEAYWVHAVISPIFDVRGKKIGYTAIRHDITDKVRLEELNTTLEERVKTEVLKSREKDQQLMQQSRLAQMGEMISMIAHQWRQPLAAISSTSAAISLKARLNKLDKELVVSLADKISDYSKHLSHTIDDFREFFKPNKSKKDITYEELIDNVLSIVEVSIVNKNIKLIKNLDCKESIFTYPNEIKQVILNLVKNAEDVLLENEIKDPYIEIKTYKEENSYILEIEDNGGGIPENIIDKIFDPYFSTKTKKDGTGLGLYMSKTIIEEHCGGELSVKNGKNGAVFRIKLFKKED